jgi:hypothetical protein
MGPPAEKEEVIRKLKKYKLSVRPFGVLRHFKKQVPLEPGQEPADSDLEAAIAKVQPHILPCAVYASYSRSQTPEALLPLWSAAPEKSLSVSLIASTLGKEIEAEIERVSRQAQANDPALWNSIARESLEQSFHFVEKLLSEEAGEENCELSPAIPAHPDILEPALAALEAHKAEISLNDSGQISPFFTGLRFCFWTPVKGKNRK